MAENGEKALEEWLERARDPEEEELLIPTFEALIDKMDRPGYFTYVNIRTFLFALENHR